MSTTGRAWHCAGTFEVTPSDDETNARAARRSARDAEYRAALRLGADEPLPTSLGRVSGHQRAGGMNRLAMTGGRMRRQVPTL